MKKQTHWLCAALILSFAMSGMAQPKEYTSCSEVLQNEALRQDFLIQGEYIISEYGITLGLHLIAQGGGKFRAVVYADGLPGDGWNAGDLRLLGNAVVNGDDITVTLNESKGTNTFGIDLPSSAEIKGKVTIGKPKDGVPGVPVQIEIVSLSGRTDIPYGICFEKLYRKSPTLGLAPPAGAVVLFDGSNLDWFPGAKMNEAAPQDSPIQGEYIISEYGYTLGMHLIADGDNKFRVIAYADGLPGDGWNAGDMHILGTAVVSGNDITFTLKESRGTNTYGIDLPDSAEIKGKVTIEKAKEGAPGVPVKIELVSVAGMSDIPYGLYFEKQYRQNPKLEGLPEGAAVLFGGAVSPLQGEYIISEYGYTLGMHLVAQGEGKYLAVAYVDGLPGDGWNAGDLHVLGTAVVSGNDITFTLKESRGTNTFGVDLPDSAEIKGKVTVEKAKEGAPGVPVKIELVSVAGMSDIPYGLYLEKQYRKNPKLVEGVPEGVAVLFGGSNPSNGNTLWAEASSKAFEKKPYKMHLEFMLSYMPQARGQARSNSGVYLDERYECQVLDSFGLEGENNECGGFYGMMKPKLNMCFPPLTWQTYDFDFTPAKWDGNTKTANARVSVKHNGVQIYDNIELPKHTPGCKDEGPAPLGVYLQGHGNKVQYRNIWIQYQ